MAILASDNVVVKIFSITGALVASFYNNTVKGETLLVNCNELYIGGLDSFSFTVTSDNDEPLFNDMECQIWVAGVHWYSGFAEYIPEQDTDEAVIEITGKGFVHKLKEKTVNKSYAAQTLDSIVKDVASTELGTEINVIYNVAKISVPVVVGITIDFEDKSLLQVFETLAEIANKDYATIPWTWGVDKEKELYFNAVSTTPVKHIFEGYDYQTPTVDKVTKIVNKVLTYRTTSADPKTTEFVATYEDTNSQGLYGLFEKKITFADFIDTTTIANIANSILEKFSAPADRIEIENLETPDKLDIGFYQLSNRRDNYYLSVNEMEDISDWDTTGMIVSTPTIDTAEVFTGRKALKIVTAVGSAGDTMSYDLPVPIQFPNIFRVFVLLDDSNADITIRLRDSNNNTVDINFGEAGDLSGEWLKRLTPVSILLSTDIIIMDDSVLGTDDLVIDDSVLGTNEVTVDTSTREALIDLVSVDIIINNNNVSLLYIDSIQMEANTYLHRELILEEIEYELSKSLLAKVSFGERQESLIDEIGKDVKAGNTALAVFSKQ